MTEVHWTGAELRASREALGLSVTGLSDAVVNPTTGAPWKQSRVSECERRVRRVPAWLPEQLLALEQARDRLTALMVGALTGDPELALVVHATDASLHAAHPEMTGIPACVHRVAAALAAAQVERDTGERPRIAFAEAGQAPGAPSMN